MKTLFAVGLLAAASIVHAQDVTAWGKMTKQSYAECGFVGAAGVIMGTVSPKEINEAGACVNAKLQAAKDEFQALPPRRPKADAALKDYYAAWIAAMRSVPGLLTQPRGLSSNSSNATQQRLNELWARFEIEM